MKITEKQFDQMLQFARKLIQAPSPSMAEGQTAAVIEQEMHRLGYDEVRRDELGNVIGIVQGKGGGPTIMFNGHMDTVEVTDAESWEHGPFEGFVDENFLHGRGTADMKGSLAVMVHCGGLLKQLSGDWPGRLIVAAVVLEERGVGSGTKAVMEQTKFDVAIVGEPTVNQLVIGHRGKGEIIARVRGKSCHASMPDKGVNPLFSMAEFIRRVEQMSMPEDELLGKATLTPTLLRTDQTSSNVIASQAELYLDWRSVPGQQREDLLAELNRILGLCLTDGASGAVRFSQFSGICYTGKTVESGAWMPCLSTDPNDPLVQIAQKTLAESLGREVQPGAVSFATDGSYMAEKGVPTIVFGPGDPGMAHVRNERIELAQMREALGALPMLASRLFRELGK